MSLQPINIGAAPNDGTGDTIRAAFGKVNANDTDLDTRKANTADVDAALALKANADDVDAALALKANADDVDAALAGKVDKVAGQSLMTDAERTKLAGVQAGAQVNAVTTVAGRTGAVTLAKVDVGLSNVDNTSDANKPVSTAQAVALALKLDKAGGTVTGDLLLSSTPTVADNTAKAVSSSWIRSAMANIATSAGFVFFLSYQGYIKFPSWLGGWIVQWGGVSTNAANGESGTTFPFPIVWPNVCYRMISSDGGSAVASTAVSAINNSTFRAWTRDVQATGAPYASFGATYIAIGY